MAKKNEVIAEFGAEDKSNNAIQSAKARLKELKQEMTALALAGKANTEQFRALSQEAGNLNDTMADVSQTIKNVGSDTKQIEVFSEAVRGIAAGFAIAQGATALFGEENEELQKTLVQVQGAMALLNGVTEITNLLQAESQIMIRANAIALGLYNNAMRVFGVTTTTATISLRAFKIALATTGIGAVVVALAYLAEGMAKTTKATKDAEKAKLNYESVKSNSENRIKEFDNETTIIVNNLKIRNASELVIAKTIAERIRLRNIESQQIINANQSEIDRLNKLQAKQKEVIDQNNEYRKKAQQWNNENKTTGIGGNLTGGGGFNVNPFARMVQDLSGEEKNFAETQAIIDKLTTETIQLKQSITILTQEGQLGINQAIKNAGKTTTDSAKKNLEDVREFIEQARQTIRDANETQQQQELNAIDDRYKQIALKIIKGSDEEKQLIELKEKEKQAVRDKYNKEQNEKYIEFLKQQNIALRKANKTELEQSIIDVETQFEELLNQFKIGSDERIALELLLQQRLAAIRKEYADKQAIEDSKNFDKSLDALGDWIGEWITKSKQLVATSKENTFDLLQDATTSVFGAIDDVITSTAGKSEAAQRKAFEQSKKFALAETIISTYASAQKAYQSQLNLLPDSPIRAAIAAGSAIVAGLGRFVKIQQTQFESASMSGSGSTGSVTGGMQSPNFGGGALNPNPSLGNLSNPNANNPNFNMSNGQSTTQPIRAYVVERDVTTTGQRIRRLEEFATLGN
jgi:hypothetical protein